MTRLSFVAAVCAAMSVSTAAMAAPPPAAAPAPAAAQPSAKQLELSRRYFKAMDMQKMLSTITDGVFGAMMSGPSMEKLPPEMRQALVETMRETSAARYVSMEERYIEMFAAEFSEDELQALVDFYESPVGRSVMAKAGRMAARSGELAKEMQPAMMADFENRFCAKIKEKPGCMGLAGKLY